ncbi:bifunctional RNase H/acid phosphatase [Paenibacillus sp. TRM 82003]|uniref:bifunctional RNase H/acid phosphatase n=1 Tax=Kineococcus sp. TRM81007 TaxID=2925831 RepID=UPI001F5A994C|nr:bifunctional RNase H/acid phosphatase [Kineococcus sp. TRM81007]MCI2240164.1 bifunctional RNase H/acid phosphatase [Kineococcus sp. TRM81007]MCI3925527.1 bifunctional RNase H/acid phosphatase [Paenibacillus sp. TRM 82003]
MSARLLRVEADGGSRGNPGPAGYGALVKDAATGEVLAEVAESIGRATNNVAEYRGLLAGLRAAAEIDPSARVEVRMDSKLVVEQMSGRWQVKHADMRRLAEEARAVLPADRVDYGWIPRAQNSHADRLANEAMDAAAAGRPWQRSTGGPAAAAGPAPAGPAAPAGSAPAAGEPLELVLVRHASTPLTEQRRLSGRHGEDPELSEAGREEARRVARCAEVRGADVVVSSTLRRCRQTAEVIAEHVGAPVLLDPQWDETDFGDWDGCTTAEVVRRWPAEFAAWSADPAVAPPGGEPLVAVERRVRDAASALRARWAGKRVVLVTHGDPLRALLRECLGCGAGAQRRIRVDPGSRTLLRLHGDGSSEVVAVNRV